MGDIDSEPDRPLTSFRPLPRPTVVILIASAETAKEIWRYGLAFAIVMVGCVLAEVAYRTLHTTRLSMIFLGAVLIVAVRLGMGPAIFAALVAFGIYNFYLADPRFTLQIADAEDFFTLVVFLAVALMSGGLAGRLRDESERAKGRARSLSVLFEATKVMSTTEQEAILRARLADMLSDAVGSTAWVIGPEQSVPATAVADLEANESRMLVRLADIARRKVSTHDTLTHGPWRARTLVADGRELGAALWRTPDLSGHQMAELDALLAALIDVGAGAIARARLGVEKSEAEAVARTEQLRTALLSSISHDFRTPLSAILASASSLLEYDDRFGPETRRDLASNIAEEAERLNRFVANLLNMTKLESGVLEVDVQAVSAAEVARGACARLERRKGARRIDVQWPDGDIAVEADPLLLEQALSNFVENAVNFSPDGSLIEVIVNGSNGVVAIEVRDQGPGAAVADLPRLFDKFYKVANGRSSAQGTGLGMSIAKGLIEAMGGKVSARPRSDGGAGLSVIVEMPGAPA